MEKRALRSSFVAVAAPAPAASPPTARIDGAEHDPKHVVGHVDTIARASRKSGK